MHYFPYDVKLSLLAHSWSFLANQKARNAIVGAENLLNLYIMVWKFKCTVSVPENIHTPHTNEIGISRGGGVLYT